MAWEHDMETLVRERRSGLVGYAYLLTGELHAAQDLVQEALVRTFSRRRTGANVEQLEAYVRRAVLNTYLNTHRSRIRWSAIMHLAVEAPHSAADRSPDTIAVDRADVHAALNRLAPRERACVILRHFEDLTVPEIASRLDVSEGAVKRYLSDARRNLAPMLGVTDGEVVDTGGEAIDVATKGGRR